MSQRKRARIYGDIPSWVPIAGVVFGAITLLFFMTLVFLSVNGNEVPHGSRFLVVIVLALGAALASSFLGGSAAAQGKIPIPLIKDYPIEFSIVGGIATLILILIVGFFSYVKDNSDGNQSKPLNNKQPVKAKLPAERGTIGDQSPLLTPAVILEYRVCTGPYNHRDVSFGLDRNYGYLINNDVYKIISEYDGDFDGDILGNGSVDYYELGEGQLDEMVGIREAELDSVERTVTPLKPKNRQKKVDQKIKMFKFQRYYDYFKKNSIISNSIPASFSFPHFEYKEKLDAYLVRDLQIIHEEEKDKWPQFWSAIVFLRSFRSYLAKVVNISGRNLINLSFHVKAYTPSLDESPLRKGKEREKAIQAMSPRIIKFPLQILRPNHSVVLPLKVQLVPHFYASGLIYEPPKNDTLAVSSIGTHLFSELYKDSGEPEYDHPLWRFFSKSPSGESLKKLRVSELAQFLSEYEIKHRTLTDNELKLLESKDLSDDPVIKISTSDNYEPYDYGEMFELDYVSYQIEGQDSIYVYKRSLDLKTDYLLYEDGNCECGSCPVIFAMNKMGRWRRLQEFLSERNSLEKKGDFVVEIPITAQTLMIQEPGNEVSYLSDLQIIGKTNEGKYFGSKISQENTTIIAQDKPLFIDLKHFHDEVRNLERLYLIGKGYYLNYSKEVCPFIAPLPFELFDL